MPVSIDQFSAIASRQGVRDGGVVTVDTRQNVRLGQSRFRLVRWIRNAGIGKRAQNRRTVDAFISSLRHHYGQEVTSSLNFRALREVQSRGKPLHVRHVREAIREADEVSNSVKMAKSSNIESLIDENIAGSAYLALPGGDDLIAEVRDKVDVTRTQQRFDGEQDLSARMSEPTGESRLASAEVWASEGVKDAHKEVFLTGYGIRTAGGLEHDKLKTIVEASPLSDSLKKYHGLEFNPSRASNSLQRRLTEALTGELFTALEDPTRLPGSGTVKERIEQAIGQKAKQVVDTYLEERAQALEQLDELRALGEVTSEEMASYDAGVTCSLADVVLHHRIPPGALRGLCAARRDVPDNLRDLIATDRTMEHKLQKMLKFGTAISGIKTGLSNAEVESYLPDDANEQTYIEDCGRFLLEGKLSAEDADAIRDAAETTRPGSDLAELLNGVAAMKRAAGLQDASSEHWASAGTHLENLEMAAVALVGPNAARPGGAYTVDNGNVLTALRDSGIDAPPPDNFREVQSGKGKFSEWALTTAQAEMMDDLQDARKEPSSEYPDFIDEAVRDFSRATFVIGRNTIDWRDVDGVVDGLRRFCTDDTGNLDGKMLDSVGKLIYQRSNAMAYNRFSSGMKFNENDTYAMVKSAPFVGIPSVVFSSTYAVDRTDDGHVSVRISSNGPASVLSHPEEQVVLDGAQSKVGFDIDIEIDGRDHSARVTGMGYEFRLVPAGAGN